MIYCVPRFGRGLGFGNRLFPWARCRIFAHSQGARAIAPVWTRLALGQLLRGGIDYRAYLRQLVLWGLFRRRRDDLGPVAAFFRTMNLPRVAENDWPAYAATVPPTASAVVEFRGYVPYFAPLNGWHGLLLQELRAITKPRFLALADAHADAPIALCVRCGNDFATPAPGCERLAPNDKTPVEWFARCLDLIREQLGYPANAVVVSDGTRGQLALLLQRKNVAFARPGSAISDLLILASARVLLASGSSSFAAWGAFLGQMPSISHPGQPLADWGIVPAAGQFLGEFDPRAPDREFLRQACAAIGTPQEGA